MATANQIRANRENAKKSTGPISNEGKKIVRSNALKHGLSGGFLLPPGMEIAATEERAGQWHPSFRPFEAFDVWLVATVAAETIRIDRCRVHEAVIRERNARRAADDACWDEDRRVAVDALALNLAKRPDSIARKLRLTTQGADWLIERWNGLARILESGGQWTEAQRSLALDLLGVPLDLREDPTIIDVLDDADPAQWHLDVARREVARLRDLQKTSLISWDANDRENAIHGCDQAPDPNLRLVRRYEMASNRRLEWAVGELKSRKREPMHQLPERDRPVSDPRPSYRTDATDQEQAERADHNAQRFQTWSKLADTEVLHDFIIPDLLVDAALNDPDPEPEPEPVVIETPKLSDAVRPPTPFKGNRRARRAAAARTRQAR